MKIEDCKEGMLVIAHKKSYTGRSVKEFLGYFPLGVGRINKIIKDRNEITMMIKDKRQYGGYNIFSFKSEDIEPVERRKNGLSENE